MKGFLLKEYAEKLQSQYNDMNITIKKMTQEVGSSHALNTMLNVELCKGFTLVNTLMDEAQKQSTISKALDQELTDIKSRMRTINIGLVGAEDDLAMTKRVEQSLEKQLVMANNDLNIQQSSTEVSAQNALVLQRQVHRMHDEISSTSTELDVALQDMSHCAEAALSSAEVLHSLITSLDRLLFLIPDEKNSVKNVWNQRGIVCVHALAKKCCILPDLRSISLDLLTKGCWNATVQDVKIMEQAIKMLNTYQNLVTKRKHLSAELENILNQEQVLLMELNAAKTDLQNKHKVIRQKMLQEDLASIEAQNKAMMIFKNIEGASQVMQNVVKAQEEDTLRRECLKEREAQLRQHKVHLMRTLGELRQANAKRQNRKLKEAASMKVRNQRRELLFHQDKDDISLLKSTRQRVRNMENKVLESSVRQLVYQTILDTISNSNHPYV